MDERYTPILSDEERAALRAQRAARRKAAQEARRRRQIRQLLPVGAVLLILNIVLPNRFFWQVYIMQIINIAGAAGEFYAAYRLVKEKKEAAVVDDGVQLRYWT